MNVSAKDFEYMKEYLIREILTIMVNEQHMTMAVAFDRLYYSDLMRKIESPKSGFYYQSPRYVLSYL